MKPSPSSPGRESEGSLLPFPLEVAFFLFFGLAGTAEWLRPKAASASMRFFLSNSIRVRVRVRVSVSSFRIQAVWQVCRWQLPPLWWPVFGFQAPFRSVLLRPIRERSRSALGSRLGRIGGRRLFQSLRLHETLLHLCVLSLELVVSLPRLEVQCNRNSPSGRHCLHRWPEF